MAETFFQKLQRVKPADIGHIFKFLLALPCSVFYRRKRKEMWLICDNENEARDLANKYDAKYMEVSAKNGLNIDRLFEKDENEDSYTE